MLNRCVSRRSRQAGRLRRGGGGGGGARAAARRSGVHPRRCPPPPTHPWFPSLCCRGVALEGLGRFDEAIRDYRSVLAAAPDDPSAWNNLGNSSAGGCGVWCGGGRVCVWGGGGGGSAGVARLPRPDAHPPHPTPHTLRSQAWGAGRRLPTATAAPRAWPRALALPRPTRRSRGISWGRTRPPCARCGACCRATLHGRHAPPLAFHPPPPPHTPTHPPTPPPHTLTHHTPTHAAPCCASTLISMTCMPRWLQPCGRAGRPAPRRRSGGGCATLATATAPGCAPTAAGPPA